MDLYLELIKIWHHLSSLKTKFINLLWISVVSIAFIIVISLSIIVLIFTLDQISIVRQIPIEKSLAHFIFDIIGINVTSLSQIQYSAILSSASGSIGLLVAMWFAVFSTYSLWKHKRDLKRQAIVQTEPIYQDGVDDLKIMLKYYKLAGHVDVFAGDFDWITKNEELKNIIIELAKQEKIDLYSYKKEETVKKNINDDELYNHLLKPRFHFDEKKEIKCSLVEMKGNRVFLYKSEQRIIGGENNICIIQGIDEGQYLLQMITILLGLHLDKKQCLLQIITNLEL